VLWCAPITPPVCVGSGLTLSTTLGIRCCTRDAALSPTSMLLAFDGVPALSHSPGLLSLCEGAPVPACDGGLEGITVVQLLSG